MRKILTKQSIIEDNSECARYLRNNPLQKKTENAQDTNVTIHYKRKQRMHKILT